MSATQHDTRAHLRRSRSSQWERLPLLTLSTQQPATSAGRELQGLHPVARFALGRLTSRADFVETLRPPVASKSAPAKVQGREGSVVRPVTLLDAPRTPSVAIPASFRDGTPCHMTSLAKNRDLVFTAKRKPARSIQGAFHHSKHARAMHRRASFTTQTGLRKEF